MNVVIRRLHITCFFLEKLEYREKYRRYEKSVNMFSVEFCEYFLEINFLSTFVDLGVA